MTNLATLVLDAAEANPGGRFGVSEDPTTLGAAVTGAVAAAEAIRDEGVVAGSRVALVGHTSTEYLRTWLALQLCGAEAALVNPTYTDRMVAALCEVLGPSHVVTSGRELCGTGGAPVIAADSLPDGADRVPAQHDAVSRARRLPGVERGALDVAGYMHTSGTTGLPKFCAQSHEYFLRLGRSIAGALSLRPDDTVFAPLPMYHVNPLGYGVLGALTASAGVLGSERFSATSFWPQVQDHEITALVMHAPPVEILKRRAGSPGPAHRVRTMFYADAEFMRTFAIPEAVTAYGSTEVGGVSHLHRWTRQEAERAEADGRDIARFGGEVREDLEAQVRSDGSILVRELAPGALFSGYLDGGEVVPATDADGWFDTGDIGRVLDDGGLQFVERRAESIRVKGEYVPIPFVESTVATVADLDDFAIWRRGGDLGDEVVLYVAGPMPEPRSVVRAIDALPGFMRPHAMLEVAEIPRDGGVGKVQRRRLDDLEPLREVPL